MEILTKTVKTRKSHHCEWCGEDIPVRDIAVYHVGVYDGFQWYWMHPECYDAMLEGIADNGGGDFEFEVYINQRGVY